MGGSHLPVAKARLYLDVDAMLNPYVEPGEVPGSWPDFREGFLGRRLVVWSPSMLAAIARLPVELVWVTTRGGEVERSFGPALGSKPPRRVLDLATVGIGTAGPKPAAIARDRQASPAPNVWVDDDAITPPGVDQLAGFGQPMLTICPDRRTGLERHHVRQVETFLESLAS